MLALVALALLAAPDWRPIAPGVEYRVFEALHVVRIDPAVAQLSLHARSELGGAPRTAAQWSKERGLVVAMNAGMFHGDHSSHVGYLRHGKHVNQKTWNGYQSVLVFGATKPGLPPARILDREEPGFDPAIAGYATVIQNLRLIRGSGESVWKKQPRRWSEAAVASDDRGRILLLFSRPGRSMADFNALVLGLPLGLQRAQHMEGGPEASLSIHGGGVDLDLAGSFETGFLEDDHNASQWPIPFVIGVSK